MTQTVQSDDKRAEAAIDWMVDLSSGETSDQTHSAFEAWLQADSRNEAAWVRLQERLMPCGIVARQGLRKRALTDRLLGKEQNRRGFLAGIAGVVGVGTVGFATADRFLSASHLFADHFTLTGQQERVALAEGSGLVLAPRTAINLRLDRGVRGFALLDGSVLVDVAARSAPFEIDAATLDLTTSSGKFLIERSPGRSAVCCIAGTSRVAHDGAFYSLGPGEQIAIAGDRMSRGTVDPEVVTAWVDGLLIAKDRTLAAIVDSIRPYFPGIIRVDPAVASLHATGVFSLRQPNDALDSVAATLDLSLIRIAKYYVSIGPMQS